MAPDSHQESLGSLRQTTTSLTLQAALITLKVMDKWNGLLEQSRSYYRMRGSLDI